MGKRKGFSRRRAAAIILQQLSRVAALHVSYGEILNPVPWLKVLANILSSVPPSWLGERRDVPEFFGLSPGALWRAARRCGVETTSYQIMDQAAETKAWRTKESSRLGRPHYLRMKPDVIGTTLGIVPEIRDEAKA